MSLAQVQVHALGGPKPCAALSATGEGGNVRWGEGPEQKPGGGTPLKSAVSPQKEGAVGDETAWGQTGEGPEYQHKVG